MLPMMPAAAVQLSQLRQRGGGGDGDGGGSGINDLLDDFTSLGDIEWKLLVSALVLVMSFVYMLISALLIRLAPNHLSSYWYFTLYVSAFCFVSTLVYLVEPRPMHWLPMLGRVRRGLGSTSELKRRVRGWWRWRKRYETRTKLNV